MTGHWPDWPKSGAMGPSGLTRGWTRTTSRSSRASPTGSAPANVRTMRAQRWGLRWRMSLIHNCRRSMQTVLGHPPAANPAWHKWEVRYMHVRLTTVRLVYRSAVSLALGSTLLVAPAPMSAAADAIDASLPTVVDATDASLQAAVITPTVSCQALA